ncbi:hypothetical protein ACGFYA_19545 [Streptomyces sp. NPDC048305]|uniref:hypothetical protein n=1 Tax=Streptomyces sp. NPDC048305 TaxID=3365532 RepID=UPI00371166E8
MHGYGYPPQQQPKRRPSSATLVTLRVVFVALALFSCTFLSWAAMLRLAIVTRKPRDWWMFGLVLALTIGFVVYVGLLPTEEGEELTDGQAITVLAWMLILFAGTVTYYLYMEIRHFGPQPGPAPVAYPNPYAGGRPGVPTAGANAQHPTMPAGPQPSYGYPPAPRQDPAPVPPADPPRATPPGRLDQVRAELDELSDYLRKEGDNR